MIAASNVLAQKQTAPREIWDREYSLIKVIPSSTRTEPARAIARLDSLWRTHPSMTILDAGAGTGRNAIYLARLGHHVVAQDFSTVALGLMRHAVRSQGLNQGISVVEASLHDELPYPDDKFDLVLDSYVSCHFLEEKLKDHYWSEVRRVVRPGGLVFSSQFSVEDEYYEELGLDPHLAGSVVIDPRNDIPKQLHTRQSIVDLFDKRFEIQQLDDIEFDDVVVGRNYHRSIIAAVVQKP